MMKLNRASRLFFQLIPFKILSRVLPRLNSFKFIRETRNTQTPITFKHWYDRYVLRKNIGAHWPIHQTSSVINPENIYCGIETSPGYSPGNYIQAKGRIYIGDYTQIAPNVGIISSNHDLYDNSKHIIRKVIVGKYCWIGMGAILLPGVKLGDYTIVAAGAIVTKSFEEGFCVLAGNPARLVKKLDKEKCVFHQSQYEYNGFIPNSKFRLSEKEINRSE